MKKFAKIENNLIVNLAIFGDDMDTPDGWIDVTDVVCSMGDPIGEDGIPVPKPTKYHTMMADNTGWEIPHENQELLNEETKAQTKEAYYQEYLDTLDQGLEYDGQIYQCDPESVEGWNQFKSLVETMDSDTIIQIRAMDNSMQDITAENFLTQFVPALGIHVLTARQEYWAKVDAL